MKYSVIPTGKFKKEALRLIQKYPSLRSELGELNIILSDNPEAGTPLGFNAFKIRVSIKSKGKGKRGGGRVITYVVTKNKEVYLLTIYDKSEFEAIDLKTIKALIEALNTGK